MAYGVGLAGPYAYDGAIPNDYLAASMLYYVNRAPLVTRLPDRAVKGTVVKAVDDAYRPNYQALGADVNTTATTFTVTDAYSYGVGDVCEIDSEQVLVTAVASSTTLTVSRAANGTTAANHTTNTSLYMVGNTRTGAEVDVDSNNRPFDVTSSNCQTVQKAYQVGGSTEASADMAVPMGFSSLLGWERAKAMQECLFDFERSIVYGRVNALAAGTTRPMMRGLKQRITTNAVTSPTNASSYKPSDFVRDAISLGVTGGGMVDVVICSEEYRTGFAIWGLNLSQLRQGDTVLGVDLQAFRIPGVEAAIVFSPLLRPYTAIGLTSSEVYMAWKRMPFDKPRGSRGDAEEGDIIGEGTVVLNNEAHHTFVTGVTAFAKQS